MAKIGFDARFYGPRSRGLGRYTVKLLEKLEQLDKENQYTVFLRKENYHLYHPGSPNFIKKLADIPWYSFREQLVFLRILNRENFDLMHFPHFNVPFFYKKPFVVTIHDLILMNHPTREATRLNPLYYKIKEWGYKRVLEHAVLGSKKIIAVSDFTKQDILTHFLVPKEKIKVIHEACEMPLIKLKLTKEKEGLVVNGQRIRGPYVFYTGAAYPHKNLKRLLVAFDLIRRQKRFRDLVLVLAGGGDYFYQRLANWTLKQKIKGVLFLGFVEKEEELMALYRGAEVFVFPSIYEGFGFPPLEAMSLRTPVVASFCASLPEILGQAAYYFDPLNSEEMAQKIIDLLTDQKLRQRLVREGEKRCQYFNWQTTGKETVATYKEVLK